MLARKVPALFAYEKMLDYSAGHFDDMKNFSHQRVNALAKYDLVPIGKLKIFFRSHGAFRNFKTDLMSCDIDQSYWKAIYDYYPPARKYVRKFYKPARPNRRKPLKMKAYVGSPNMSEVSDEDSVLSVSSNDDNVNFPKPVCQGIRRVCRYYDDARRYRPYENDESEDDRYVFGLRYN